MLTVIKRLGHEEAFDIQKIINSLAAASDELRQPFCDSDIHNLAADIEKRVEGMEKITSKELFAITIETIFREGFEDLAHAYLDSGLSHWRE